MKLKRMFRAMSADAVQLDPKSRAVEFSFSSELPVERWFGKEVLSHQVGAADLARLNDGGALLWNHNSDEMIGVVDSAEIRSDKKGYAKVRFADTARANEVMKMVQDGILRNVSFGYQIQEMTLLNPNVKDQEPEYLATRWAPYEVSFVSIPADPTVGVGRADSGEELEVKVINKQTLEGVRKMEPEVKPAPVIDTGAMKAEAVKAERERIAAIHALGEQFKQTELARQFIESGKPLEEMRAAILEKLGAVQKPVTETQGELGMTEKETRKYSFVKALHALANPQDRKAQQDAAFERECSVAAEKAHGKPSQGLMIPVDVLRNHGKRDLTVGSNSGGGYSVATDLLAGSFIDLLRNRMVLQRLGAQSLNGLQGNISIPKLAGAATAYWVAENTAPTESALSLGQVAMSPKTVGAFSDISRRLLIQSSLDVENMVKNDLALVLALAIDAKGLYGDGSSNTITGVRYASSLNTVDFANADPTYAEIVDMETQVAADNADIGSLAYAVNAAGRGKLKSTLITATYGDRMIWQPDNTVNGYRVEVSNQVSKLSTADYDYWFGNWSDLILGFWGGLDLMVDPYTGSSAGTVRVVALQDVDCAVRHGESFCYGNKTIV